jgi:putative aldouronate transport system substrate-binding protein
MKKKGLFVFVAGLLVLALFIGCKKPVPASAPAQEITVEVFDRGTDGGRSNAIKNNYTDWIEEKLLKDENIKISFVAIPRGEEVPGLNRMMAAGNAPDISYTYDQALIANYRDLGGLYNMANNITRLLPDLDKFLGEDPMLPGRRFVNRARDSATGGVYAIPARRTNTARINTFIRKDWLDKLGLPLPQTTQQFYEAMVAFKQRDPGGIGRDRVIPMTSSNVNARWNFGNLLDSFIDPNISTRDEWINVVVDRHFLLPGFKDGVRFLNRMYNEDLIDKDYPLHQNDDAIFNLMKAGLVGSLQHNYDMLYRDSPGVYRDLAANVPGATYVPIDPFHHSSGKTMKYAYDAAGIYFIIPSTAKFPEAAMRYVNWLTKVENNSFIQLGPEGVGYDMVNGIPRVKPITGLWIQNSPQNIDYTISINGMELGDESKNMQYLVNSYNVDPQFIISAYELSMKNTRVLSVIPVTLTAAGPVQADLHTKGDRLLAESITCSPGQFDRIWDDGIRDWLASGAETVRAERTAKYVAP